MKFLKWCCAIELRDLVIVALLTIQARNASEKGYAGETLFLWAFALLFFFVQPRRD